MSPATAERALLGDEMWSFVERAFPICRSITGEGLRKTLGMLRERLPGLQLVEIESGTRVLDWIVPDEWNVREAWLRSESGETVVDFAHHNLHLMSYSVPTRGTFSLQALREEDHLYTLPDQPDRIPYRTSYYRPHWAFCLAHDLLEELPHGNYEVLVDTSLEKGSLTYGELLVRGRSEQELLISAHVCHPSLANDNLSGVAVCSQLAAELSRRSSLRYSYRFLFAPGTIGAISWLAHNRATTERIRFGLTAANLGDSGGFSYKRSRQGRAAIDRLVLEALEGRGVTAQTETFFPDGYDERQFCSPGFDLPVGALSRSRWGKFPEYHTSADNLDFIDRENLLTSLDLLREVVDRVEGDRSAAVELPATDSLTDTPQGPVYRNLKPFGEPFLGRYGIMDWISSDRDRRGAVLWLLNLGDGRHDLAAVAARSNLPSGLLEDAASQLVEVGLLAPV